MPIVVGRVTVEYLGSVIDNIVMEDGVARGIRYPEPEFVVAGSVPLKGVVVSEEYPEADATNTGSNDRVAIAVEGDSIHTNEDIASVVLGEGSVGEDCERASRCMGGAG